MPTSIDDNIHTVREHYDRLFDLVDGSKAYDSEGFRQRPPIVNMGYWLNNPKTARAAQEQFVRELANRVLDLKGKRVIDAGCGLAGPAALLACDYGAEVDGVNIVARRVEWARRYIEGNGISDKVRARERDGSAVSRSVLRCRLLPGGRTLRYRQAAVPAGGSSCPAARKAPACRHRRHDASAVGQLAAGPKAESRQGL